jgi:hypothetical protein
MLRALIEVVELSVLLHFISVRTSKAVENNSTTVAHPVRLLQTVCITNLS